ncbi:MAG: FAD-binding oxidoreductase [Phenylobacterium sp.]|uniref:NAD(P)/FAD-dependent oxidoreductase n=1 Tax=Phenylobacterium sp. TaxID=1871053 RepID=UPI003BB5A1F3
MTACPSRQVFDVVVLGGGIAGAALAAQLAGDLRVALVERESQLGYHTTGRSAAMYIPSYGGPAVQPLTAASRGFFERPPWGFAGRLLSPRPVLHVARADQLRRLEDFAHQNRDTAALRRLSGESARLRAPILRPEAVRSALLEAGAGDLDVARLHGGMVRRAREAGAAILADAGRPDIVREGSRWRVRTRQASLIAPTLVNATGAWADETALDAGLAPKALAPLLRTAILVDAPRELGFHDGPVVKDIDERFYFRPFGGRLLITPADETPSPPCDAAPDELDIACAMMRFHDAADHPVTRIHHRWAGLRTFASDRAPVIGWSETSPGFFWLAGLGGFGIQTAPAVARLAAAQVLGHRPPADLADHGVEAATYDPGRLSEAAPPIGSPAPGREPWARADRPPGLPGY